MPYEIYDAWSNTFTRGLTYDEAKQFCEREEPPFNPRAGWRYFMMGQSFPDADSGQSAAARYTLSHESNHAT
jgi:hypothetical protein